MMSYLYLNCQKLTADYQYIRYIAKYNVGVRGVIKWQWGGIKRRSKTVYGRRKIV